MWPLFVELARIQRTFLGTRVGNKPREKEKTYKDDREAKRDMLVSVACWKGNSHTDGRKTSATGFSSSDRPSPPRLCVCVRTLRCATFFLWTVFPFPFAIYNVHHRGCLVLFLFVSVLTSLVASLRGETRFYQSLWASKRSPSF